MFTAPYPRGQRGAHFPQNQAPRLIRRVCKCELYDRSLRCMFDVFYLRWDSRLQQKSARDPCVVEQLRYLLLLLDSETETVEMEPQMASRISLALIQNII